MNPCTFELSSTEGKISVADIRGDWVMGNTVPGFQSVKQLLEKQNCEQLDLKSDNLGHWDSRFVVFLFDLEAYCKGQGIVLNMEQLPDSAQGLLHQASAFPVRESGQKVLHETALLVQIGQHALGMYKQTQDMLAFVGEVCLSSLRLLRGKACFRQRDLWLIMQECGPGALAIVTLISLLVGLILAFVGAMQLKIFGAQIYVANLVGLGMAREMGAMMTAIIMAGRTGAAFASQLGSMRVNEEIDALETLGISPIDFLVLPRMLALIIMLPLLCLYADLMGILGGLLVSATLLDISVVEYFIQTKSALDLNDFLTGLIKSSVFGVLVALSGCLSGMQCGRSSSSVGDAATAAVVAGIVSIVVADAVLTVVYQIIGF
ncbi:MAG: ABC transporter permease [Methyloprofundus sp.]|uniref:MlaE family ABC transporter permease n=1 Tax=Methyloprofundus sp. TaxID=2020875 RepID=UPI0026277581|nr:ABC transporter permease [Methyloprofundus sp.]